MCLRPFNQFWKRSGSHPVTQPEPSSSDTPARRDAATQTTPTPCTHASTQTDEAPTTSVGMHTLSVEPRAPLPSMEARLGLSTGSARPSRSITFSEPSYEQRARHKSSRGIFEPEPHVSRPITEPTPTKTTSPSLSPWFVRER